MRGFAHRLALLLLLPLSLAASPWHSATLQSAPTRSFLLLMPHGVLAAIVKLFLSAGLRPYTLSETKALQISRTRLLFDADLPTVRSILPGEPLAAERERTKLASPVITEDVVQQERERDQILLVAHPTPKVVLGAAVTMLTGISVLTAQPPRSLRFMFSGPISVGPATFDYGGLGLGLRAKLRLGGG
jgi:hypothetical protein